MNKSSASAFLFPLAAVIALPLTAQTAAKAPVHRTAPATHRAASAASSCAKLPVISPKIPAVNSGATCAKTMYTISSSVTALSPMLSAPLRENLKKLDQSFSLSYIDTHIGTGELAQPKKYYTVNYTGYLLDGTKFDSSLDRKEPITFPYGAHNVIQGWDTGFEGMRMGGKRRLFVPYQLAYGDRGRPPVIPPQSELIFDVELISQSDAPPAPKTPPTPPAPPTSAQPATQAKPDATPATQAKPATPGSAPAATTTPAPAPKPQ